MMTMITTTANNARSLLPLQTNMTEAGTGGTTAEATINDEDVVVNTASKTDEVDEDVVEDTEVNPRNSITSAMTPTKKTEAVSPGTATEAPAEDTTETTTSRQMERFLSPKQ